MSKRSSLAAVAICTVVALGGCGGGSDSAKPSKTAAVDPDEQAVRSTLNAYFKANSTGDYEAVCSLFTPQAQKAAAKTHDSGGSSDCVKAFNAEAQGLGPSLKDANAIYANAKIANVTIANDAATATILY